VLATAERKSELLKELNQNATARPDLQRSSEKARELHALKWLRAPVSGYVQSVSVTNTGGVVTPAQPLVSIVPDDTPLEMEASLSNEDVGYVQVGQPVDVKIDTYPYQRYGTVRGTLTAISPDAERRETSAANNAAGLSRTDVDTRPDPSAQRAAPTYRVRVAIDMKTVPLINGQPARLLPGMSGQADIKTDRRKIYEFFLSPVVKHLDEGTRVR
jgi:hemolysin D